MSTANKNADLRPSFTQPEVALQARDLGRSIQPTGMIGYRGDAIRFGITVAFVLLIRGGKPPVDWLASCSVTMASDVGTTINER